MGGLGGDETSVFGYTDKDGRVTAAAPTTGLVGFSVTKTGYYLTTGQHDFSKSEHGRWQPWNPTVEAVLKRIVNPVPLFAKNLQTQIPVYDKPVSFDLMEGDWLAPYGKGIAGDFVFTVSRQGPSWNDHEAKLRLAFSNEGDGIQAVFARSRPGSELQLAHHAPAEGYQSELVLKRWWHPGVGNRSENRNDQNYWFRVRAKDNRALYGKIHGDIVFYAGHPNKPAGLQFTYYLNPDGTRNVEFDSKRNLFRNLKPPEEVRSP